MITRYCSSKIKLNRLFHKKTHLLQATSAFSSLSSSQAFQQQDGNGNWKASVSALLAIGSATALTASQLNKRENSVAECCGIAGVVSSNPKIGSTSQVFDAREFLLDSLTVLKNRGYDSAGLATISTDQQMHVTKYASIGENADGVELVREHSADSMGHSVGIAHTRWATHGGKTNENAHPHQDSSGKIALVHNGTINNANELRKLLIDKGHKFSSQTDTEVIAKLIGDYYANSDTTDLEKRTLEATEAALRHCDGTWGLCIANVECPDALIVACNGSPLVIGVGSDKTFVASETSAFNRQTKNFIAMKDGEIGIVHADGRTLDLKRIQKAPHQDIILSPDPYPHWTLKECLEQPEAIARALGFGGRLSPDRILLGGLDGQFERMSQVRHMTLSACGTSLNAALYAEKLMKSLGCFESVTSLDAAETSVRDFPNTKNVAESGLIVVSQSGETKDVHRVVKAAKEEGVTVMSVVNAVGSLIARTTKVGCYLNAGRENAVASTKAFTTQVTVLALIALWFRQAKDKINGIESKSNISFELKEALMRLPITFGMAMKTRDKCKKIAERLKDKEHCFVLGKGFGEPVAYEGALKIKECCYLHAEGYSGGALKHGPFALIEGDTGKFGATPIVLLIFDDCHTHHMRTAAEEVKARGADIIVITDKPSLAEGLDDDPIVVPPNGPLTALGAVLPLQLIAYELAVLKGINPDTPRNLAKAVTVD